MNDDAYRRMIGLLLGAGIGLLFGLISQSINYLLLPGLPIYLPPFGATVNAIGVFLLGVVVGTLVAWPENGIHGVVAGSLLGALVIAASLLAPGTIAPGMLSNRIIGLTIIFIPVMAMFVPLMVLLRWMVAREATAHREQFTLGERWSPRRLILPVLVLAAAALLGYALRYPGYGQSATLHMQHMLQQGMQAQTDDDLPRPFQPPDVKQFREKAQSAYTLQWERDETNKYAIPRISGTDPASLVIARFPTNWMVVCVYTSTERDPTCRDFNQ